MPKRMALLLASLTMSACVSASDLAAWRGQPVSALDRHPFFNTLPVEIRFLEDGTEIRNYVNGANIDRCFGGASANSLGRYSVIVTGNSFCSTGFAACNNQFYIKDGVVLDYIPVGSGRARCMTGEMTRPYQFQVSALAE